MVTDLIVLLFKCLIVGIIWATFLLPVLFRQGSLVKYLLCVLIVAALAYFFRHYATIINQMTIIALIALIISWITSMAFFANESKVKSKVIAFSALISGLSYMIVTLFVNIKIF